MSLPVAMRLLLFPEQLGRYKLFFYSHRPFHECHLSINFINILCYFSEKLSQNIIY